MKMNIDDIKNVVIKANKEMCEKEGVSIPPIVEVQRDGDNYNVVKDGVIVRAFNDLSDDWALTKAYQLKRELQDDK